jgi:hypothetical protein
MKMNSLTECHRPSQPGLALLLDEGEDEGKGMDFRRHGRPRSSDRFGHNLENYDIARQVPDSGLLSQKDIGFPAPRRWVRFRFSVFALWTILYNVPS